MDSIHHVNADMKKHDGRGDSSPMTNGKNNGSAADVFSTLMEAVTSRSASIFSVPTMDSNLTRSDDTPKPREQETRNTKNDRNKNDAHVTNKPAPKTRDREDDGPEDSKAKVANKSGSTLQTQKQDTRDTDRDTRYIKKDDAHDTDKPIPRTRDKENDGPGVSNDKAVDNATSSQERKIIKDNQANTARNIAQESKVTGPRAISEVVGKNTLGTVSLEKIISKEVSNKETLATAVKSESLPLKVIQVVGEANPVAEENNHSELKKFHQSNDISAQTQQGVDDDTAKLQALQFEGPVVSESSNKEAVANVVGYESLGLKEGQADTKTKYLAEENNDSELKQFHQSNDISTLTQQPFDGDAAKLQISQVASPVIAESPNKEAAVNPVKSEGSTITVTQAVTENITMAKENGDRLLPQRSQLTNTVAQAQQGIDETVAKGEVFKAEDQAIAKAKDTAKSLNTAIVHDNTKTQFSANSQVNKNAQDSTHVQDGWQKSATDLKSQAATKTQDHGQKSSLDLRTAAAQEQSQSLSRALANDNKTQIQVTVQGQQGVITKPADLNVPNVYSSLNQTNIPSPASISDTTNAMLFSPRSPAEQVQAPITAVPPAPLAPQPQSQTSQQGGSSAKTSLRTDGAAPTLPQPGQTNGSQMQNNTSFSLNAGQSTQTGNETARTSQPTATDKPRTTPQQIIDQIKVKITRASKAGMDRVTIQLKPESLGRIEVKLEMSEDHQVRVTVTANSKETLQILQTDARGLERALNEAGLRTDANNLHFNLRSDGNSQRADGDQNGAGNDQADNKNDAANEDGSLPIYDYSEAARARGGVDTFA